MEGLLIAQLLSQLPPLPQERGAWRFPDPATFVLPLGETTLWFHSAPPDPSLELKHGRAPAPAGAPSSFQQLLRARAAGAPERVEQLKLDRVVEFTFSGSEGFISTEPVRLVAELTGRNANLILLDARAVILGVQREVGGSRNRYRQLLPGLPYTPPPAYERPDPRETGAEAAARLLLDRELRQLPATLDGFGPLLTQATASLAGLAVDTVIGEQHLPALTRALGEVLADPAAAAATVRGRAGAREARRERERERLEAGVRRELERRRRLLERRLADTEHLRSLAGRAAELRGHAELLLAYRPSAEPAGTVTLPDFSGNDVTIRLEPGLDAVGSAEALFRRARRHEQRFQTAEELRPQLEQELRDTAAELDGLARLDHAELKERAVTSVPEERGRHRTLPGMRIEGPHGFEVVVGRNARDNDRVTFGIARSRDVWLHVQGYRGSHVIIRAGNREVPFDTILFAAQLAAGHSQAAGSDNVAVDWTLRKNVWRPKGAAAGAVHFTAQKTVYVTPRKHPADPESAQG